MYKNYIPTVPTIYQGQDDDESCLPWDVYYAYSGFVGH